MASLNQRVRCGTLASRERMVEVIIIREMSTHTWSYYYAWYEGGPTSQQQFLFSELLFGFILFADIVLEDGSNLIWGSSNISDCWCVSFERKIRARLLCLLRFVLIWRCGLRIQFITRWQISLTSGWKISLAILADTYAEQIYCWQISLTKLADVLLTNLSHQSRWYFSLQISEGKEKESDAVSTDKSRSKDEPVRRGKQEYGWNHTWPETSRQKNKGWACKERKAGVWMEPYLAWSLATEWQWMSLNGSSRTRLDYPVSAITSSVERN